MLLLRLVLRPMALTLGVKPHSSMVFLTRSSVSLEYPPFLLMTLETVAMETPAFFATSIMDTRLLPSILPSHSYTARMCLKKHSLQMTQGSLQTRPRACTLLSPIIIMRFQYMSSQVPRRRAGIPARAAVSPRKGDRQRDVPCLIYLKP